jgi:D-sedoheptulose 7-phosphate isomerase
MLGFRLDVDQYIHRLQAELDRLDRNEVRALSDLLYQAWKDGRFVFILGNGGSATLASHLAEDLGKTCQGKLHPGDAATRRLKVLSLADNTGWLTALGNDLGYERVFVEQLMQYASPGDLVIAISGSGNSPNVLAAVDWANRNGLATYAMTGFDGGKLKTMRSAGFHVPLDDMAMAESLHLCATHWVVDDLAARMTGQGRYAERTEGNGDR